MMRFQIQKSTSEYARFCRLYAAQSAEPAILATHPTLDALLAALSGAARADLATRSRLLCAVVARHQAAPSPLWSAIVLHAFGGMLARLSRSLVAVDRDEADALVAAGLLEALRRVRPGRDPDRIAMYVRQETRRTVFAELRREAKARRYWPSDEDCPPGDGAPGDDAPRGDEDAAPDDDAPRGGSVYFDPDRLADPESLVPIEERLFARERTAGRIGDAELLRAHAVRGGLRRLATHLLTDAGAREREHLYRQLLRRTRRLVERRAAAAVRVRTTSEK